MQANTAGSGQNNNTNTPCSNHHHGADTSHEEGTRRRRRDLPAVFPQAWTNDAWDIPRKPHTRGCLQSPPNGAASCSGWSNGTKSVFLRGLVPFNQLQQGWQCPVLGGTEEIHLCLKLHARASLKKMTLILSYSLMFPRREKGGLPWVHK